MIGRITGTLLETQPPWLVVDVGGVGYEMEASMTTLVALPGSGEKVSLYTHLTVRDDAHLLYAFAREQERALFRALIKVNRHRAETGIGDSLGHGGGRLRALRHGGRREGSDTSTWRGQEDR